MLIKRFGFAAVALALTIGGANASLVTWDFSGTVTNEMNSSYADGNTITGSITFNTSTPGTITLPGNEFYYGAITGFTIGSFQATIVPGATNRIEILDNYVDGSFVEDAFAVYLDEGGPATPTFSLQLSVMGPTIPSAVTSLALPVTPYNLADFATDLATPVFGETSFGYMGGFVSGPPPLTGPPPTPTNVLGNINSVSSAATPLPAALPLFATGLGALGLFGWRRKRKPSAAIAAA